MQAELFRQYRTELDEIGWNGEELSFEQIIQLEQELIETRTRNRLVQHYTEELRLGWPKATMEIDN
jgi:hypothetical protein